MEKAVSYIRVSGKSQVDGDGPERQRDAIARYAKANSLEVVGEYSDLAVSGTRELEDRPGLSDLLARLASNGVRLVLVERADRLARDLMVGELILAELRKLNVRCIAADSGTELTAADGDPTRTLIRQVLGAVAEFEKSVLVAKLRAARVRKRRTDGRCEGVKPFGMLPGEDVAVQRMKALRRKPRGGAAMSWPAIAAQLNAEGVPSRSGKPWSSEVVRRILARSAK